MQSLKQRILQVLEENDSHCLDSQEERRIVARALYSMVREWFESDPDTHA